MFQFSNRDPDDTQAVSTAHIILIILLNQGLFSLLFQKVLGDYYSHTRIFNAQKWWLLHVFFFSCPEAASSSLFFGGWGEKRRHWSKFLAKIPCFFSKTSRQISPRGSVSSQTCILGYTFNGPVQNCRQLRRNLPWEARHFLLHYKIEDENTGAREYGLLPEFFFSFLICSIAETANLPRQIST